jgi:hypothetical protein
MGFRHTWLATQEDGAVVLDRLNLHVAGDADNFLSADYTLGRLPGGWLIIVSNKQVRLDKVAPVAVPNGFALTGWMNETVTVSEARGFRDGALEWAVVHNAEADPSGMRIEGTPPEPFSEIYRQAQAEQANGEDYVDYIFDVPVKLSASICGFTPDEDMDATWQALAKSSGRRETKGKGFFARLFGR